MVFVGISALFWVVWKRRNDIIFERKRINDPVGVGKLICNWILDWSILQIKDPERRILQLGAKVVERVASEIYTRRHTDGDPEFGDCEDDGSSLLPSVFVM